MPSPIDVLAGNIVNTFERPKGLFNEILKDSVHSGILDAHINYMDIDDVPSAPRVTAPFLEDGRHGPAEIFLYRSHLELLWSFTYGMVVVYEECVQRAMLDNKFDGRLIFDRPLTQRAKSLLDWSVGLHRGYTNWPEALPSPTFQADVQEADYATKVNTIFQESVATLLYHEFAHVVAGHLGAPEKSESIAAQSASIEMESEADDYAFRSLVSLEDDEYKRRLKGWSMLSAPLASLFMVEKLSDIFQLEHPHLHHRIFNILQKLNYRDQQNEFYYNYLCTIVMGLFLRIYKQDGDVQCSNIELYETAYDALQSQLDELDALQVDVDGPAALLRPRCTD